MHARSLEINVKSICCKCILLQVQLESWFVQLDRKLVWKIDEALQRIEQGSYGYCSETGEPIGVKRLEARPIATLGLEAQERHERLEKTQRSD